MASSDKGRLHSRPGATARLQPRDNGLQKLGIDGARDGLLYIPAKIDPERPAPLIIMLHGAGGAAHHSFVPLQDLADHTNTVLLAPESRGPTWDVILGGFGSDVGFIDEALSRLFHRQIIDPKKIALAGFSDGASYALSLGITNGDLFSHLIAFSPGFAAPAALTGTPPIFVSHGDKDPVLPIDTCSRRLVPKLRAAGFRVTYKEFKGEHTIPPAIAREALVWMLGPRASEEASHSSVPINASGIERT